MLRENNAGVTTRTIHKARTRLDEADGAIAIRMLRDSFGNGRQAGLRLELQATDIVKSSWRANSTPRYVRPKKKAPEGAFLLLNEIIMTTYF